MHWKTITNILLNTLNIYFCNNFQYDVVTPFHNNDEIKIFLHYIIFGSAIFTCFYKIFGLKRYILFSFLLCYDIFDLLLFRFISSCQERYKQEQR